MCRKQTLCHLVRRWDRVAIGVVVGLVMMACAGVAYSACPVFQPPISTPASSPTCVAVASLNFDPYPDMVVSEQSPQRIAVYLGNANGYSSPTYYPVTGEPLALAIWLIDHDPLYAVDIAVVTNRVNQEGLLAVFLGNGNGTFDDPIYTNAGYWPMGLALRDIDGDSHADCAVANYGTETSRVLWGNGNGGFPSRTDVFAGNALSVAIGSLNEDEDGTPDLAYGTAGTYAPLALLMRRPYPFQRQFEWASWVGPDNVAGHSVAIGNVNPWLEPTKQDIVFAGGQSGNVYVCLGDGSGTFGASPYSAGTFPISVAIGDFTGEGYADLAVADFWGDRAEVLINRYGSGSFAAPCYYAVGNGPQALALGDGNWDGVPDRILTANGYSNDISTLILAGLSLGRGAGPQADGSTTGGVGTVLEGPVGVGVVTPNPTASSATLEVTAAAPVTHAFLEAVDASGRVIARPWQGSLSPGSHRIHWSGETSSGERAPAGVYFLRFHTPNSIVTRACALLR